MLDDDDIAKSPDVSKTNDNSVKDQNLEKSDDKKEGN